MKKLLLLSACLGLLASCASEPEYIEPPKMSQQAAEESLNEAI